MSTQPGNWQQPKTDWKAGDVVSSSDLNRIEQNIVQLMVDKVGRGASNTDVELVKALLHRVDTREVVITYDAQGRPYLIEEKDGPNVVKTVTITYGPDGKPSQIQETAGGTTVTSTLQYDASGKLLSVPKAVG